MIQVLHRTLNILEQLDPEQPLSLSEIAKLLKINNATCSHIVKTLAARGYIEQLGARKGYILGPQVYHLGNKGQYRKDLTTVAMPLLHRLITETQEDATLCTLQNYTKTVLCKLFGNQEIQINRNFQTDDIYQTATGRMLLASLSDNEREKFISINGMPGDKWPSISSEKYLFTKLDDIRKNNFVLNTDPKNFVFIAVPVEEGNSNLTALGMTVPKLRFQGEYKEKVIRLLKETATEISKELKKTFKK
jgi:DNA-binding IclR family transcriptional regulator